MHENDLAYAAGFFDAEGCVLIAKSKGTTGMIHPLYYLCVKMGVTNQSIMNWFKYQFGGSLTAITGKKKQKKILFHWQISTKPAEIFLRQIFLHLQLKKPQTELAFQFQNEMRRKKPRKRVSPEFLRLREKLKNQISLLNRGHFNGRIKIPDKLKIAYAAGFLDGDGYITIHIRRFRKWNAGKNPIYCLVIGSGCLDQPIINWLQKNFDGSASTEKSSESIDSFRWRIGANKAMNFLQEILPHFRLKVPQAELGIRFQKMNRENINKRMRKRNENRKVSPEFLQRREQFRQKMLALNRDF